MCSGCLAEYDDKAPVVKSDALVKAYGLVKEVYALWSTGGPLHVEIEDMNLEDTYFTDDALVRVQHFAKKFYPETTPEQTKVWEDCWRALKRLRATERAVVAYAAYGTLDDALTDLERARADD